MGFRGNWQQNEYFGFNFEEKDFLLLSIHGNKYHTKNIQSFQA